MPDVRLRSAAMIIIEATLRDLLKILRPRQPSLLVNRLKDHRRRRRSRHLYEILHEQGIVDRPLQESNHLELPPLHLNQPTLEVVELDLGPGLLLLEPAQVRLEGGLVPREPLDLLLQRRPIRVGDRARGMAVAVDGLAAVDVLEQMLPPLDEFLVRKLPPLRIDLPKAVGIELSDEAGEVVMLEVSGEEAGSEVGGIPDDEAGLGGAPGDDLIGRGIVYHLVGLLKERSRPAASSSSSATAVFHRFLGFSFRGRCIVLSALPRLGPGAKRGVGEDFGGGGGG